MNLHFARKPAIDDSRERWIAEAAYYIAEKRGFVPGYALEDWLNAEALINFELAHGLVAHEHGAR